MMANNRINPTDSEHYSVARRLPPEELDRLRGVVYSAPFVRRVLDVMPNLVAVLTDTRQVVLANKAMCDFLGMDDEGLACGPRPGEALNCVNADLTEDGCGTSSYCSQCGAFRTIMKAVIRREHARGECRITTSKDGLTQSLELAIWCAPFDVEDYRFSLLAAVDVSDEKRRTVLEKIFFHDVLNTTQAMLSYIQLLKLTEPSEWGEMLEGLTRTADTLTEEILAQRDLLRAEIQELSISPRSISSEDLLRRVVARFHGVSATGQAPELDPNREVVQFSSDPVILGRVLGNMVKNAMEEVQADQGCVTLNCQQSDDRVVFSVHNPQVMPMEVQLQVFQRSFSTKGPGRGLGTYSMRLLTERYLEGKVNFVSSQENQGTTFYLNLPLELAENQQSELIM
jgi:hypothetical protein